VVSDASGPIDHGVWDKVRSPAHGFCDDEAIKNLLRTRPTRQALQWTERHLGCRVVSTRALRGGMSSAVHLVTVEQANGQRLEAVLRRYVRPELNIEDTDMAACEARALHFVEQIDVPTPRLLAVDATGDDAGVPALLMTRLPGRVDWWPTDGERWLWRLADLLPIIHSAPDPPPRLIRPYAPYAQTNNDPPGWARHPKAWAQAVKIASAPAPDVAAVLIQRDFHPGNVLWRRGIVSGVVDWQAASIGPAAIDVGHCRVNLLTFGRQVADRFTRLWERASGMTYDPWADVVTIVGFLDDLRSERGSEDYLLEDLLADAVAESGGAS
jgi:aminoglycoside phosphotransferase (APT) family kinase protein